MSCYSPTCLGTNLGKWIHFPTTFFHAAAPPVDSRMMFSTSARSYRTRRPDLYQGNRFIPRHLSCWIRLVGLQCHVARAPGVGVRAAGAAAVDLVGYFRRLTAVALFVLPHDRSEEHTSE